MNILQACADANLFAPWFKRRDTYKAWFAFLAALFKAFVSLDVVERCTSADLAVRPPVRALLGSYAGFVDPAGGSGADSFTLAIGHVETEGSEDTTVLDVVLERKPPFSPEGVVHNFAKTLDLYGIKRVEGDRYAGEWPREQFRKRGIEYDLADMTRSDLYLNLLPYLNSEAVDLLDIPKLKNQLVGLERRVARGGRESIDHPPGGHDDLANAVAGVVAMAKRPSLTAKTTSGRIGPGNRVIWNRR